MKKKNLIKKVETLKGTILKLQTNLVRIRLFNYVTDVHIHQDKVYFVDYNGTYFDNLNQFTNYLKSSNLI